MARRPAGCLGWIVVLVIGAGIVGSLNHRETADAPRSSTTASSPGASNRQAVETRVLYVTASSLNVRAQPETGAAVLLSAPRGTPVIAIRQVSGWYEVHLNNGSTGWMSADYLSDQAPTPPRATEAQPAQRFVQQQPSYDRNAVIRAILTLSRRSYSGSCACPDDRDRAGRRCGARSAYSKPGGASPLCYAGDVTQRMIDDYLARQGR